MDSAVRYGPDLPWVLSLYTLAILLLDGGLSTVSLLSGPLAEWHGVIASQLSDAIAIRLFMLRLLLFV